MTEASTQDVAADAGVSRRRAMLRAQRNALNVLDRSAFVRARSGLLLSGLALLGAYGGLAVALGWDASQDAYDHPDPTAPLAFYYSGQAACGIDVLGSAVLLLAAWRWSRRRRRTALLDRTESARALTGAVPAYLATRYDARHGSATGRAVDLDAQPLIASGPELRFSLAGSIGFLVGMMTGIVGLVSLWDPVDPDTGPLNHGEFLGAVLALACGVVTLLAWCGISAAVGRSAVPRGIVQVEQAVYPLVPGDRVAERATGRFNGRTVGGVSAVVPLVLISTVRAVQDGLLGLAFPGLLVALIGPLLWLARRNRTVPLLVQDRPGPAPLTCLPTCGVVVSYDGPTLTVAPRRGSRPPLVLTRDQASGLVNVRAAAPGGPLAVAVTGDDDVLAVVSGTKACQAVRDWWQAGPR